MFNDFDLCVKTLEFASKIIGSKHDVVVNTNIHRKNPDFFDSVDDIYVIKAKPKITLSCIIRLFEYMRSQFDIDIYWQMKYLLIYDFKYNKKLKRYYVVLKTCDIFVYMHHHCAYIPLGVLNFAKSVIGLKQNVIVNSGIYNHMFIEDCDKFGLNVLDDLYDLFGNADKIIDIYDVIDLLKEFSQQFNHMYDLDTGRNYSFENFFIEHMDGNSVVTWRVYWGS